MYQVTYTDNLGQVVSPLGYSLTESQLLEEFHYWNLYWILDYPQERIVVQVEPNLKAVIDAL